MEKGGREMKEKNEIFGLRYLVRASGEDVVGGTQRENSTPRPPVTIGDPDIPTGIIAYDPILRSRLLQ